MVGAPQGAMRVASQIWQVVLASQTLQVFCFGPSQKGTICSSACKCGAIYMLFKAIFLF
jgi:hypothetical protein